MKTAAIITAASAAAHAVAAIVPQGGEALKAGVAVLDLVNSLRETAGATPELIAEYESGRSALEAAVNAHAQRTADSLGDG